MKTIGFVCEGPRDLELLAAVIEHILGEDIHALPLQPDESLLGNNGNGWKGVWRWCNAHGKMLDQYMHDATPQIDMLIVQMDGDVARKEKEVHCLCNRDRCGESGSIFPLQCQKADCPVQIPCGSHEAGVSGYVEHLQNLLLNCFHGEYVPICVIPCDSTDTWIASAYEEIEGIETIDDPWNSIISVKKDFHGIRVPGHKKTKTVYEKFIHTVCQNWGTVKSRCTQAEEFERVLLQQDDHPQ